MLNTYAALRENPSNIIRPRKESAVELRWRLKSESETKFIAGIACFVLPLYFSAPIPDLLKSEDPIYLIFIKLGIIILLLIFFIICNRYGRSFIKDSKILYRASSTV